MFMGPGSRLMKHVWDTLIWDYELQISCFLLYLLPKLELALSIHVFAIGISLHFNGDIDGYSSRFDVLVLKTQFMFLGQSLLICCCYAGVPGKVHHVAS